MELLFVAHATACIGYYINTCSIQLGSWNSAASPKLVQIGQEAQRDSTSDRF